MRTAILLASGCDGRRRGANGPLDWEFARPSRLASWVGPNIRIIQVPGRASAEARGMVHFIVYADNVYADNVHAGNQEGTRVRAEILKIHAVTPETSLIKYAAEQIQAGQVLGMPTDTFYGLAADPFNLRAVERVYEIKSRLRHKPLSLLIENVDQAEE